MNWYEIVADPDTPTDGLVSVRIDGETTAAEGLALLVEVVHRAELPEAVALWVDGERAGVCRTADILTEAGADYRGPGYGGGDAADLPGPTPPPAATVPYYRCPSCTHAGYIPMERYALCDNGHPIQRMVRQP